MARRLDTRDPGFAQDFAAVVLDKREAAEDVEQVVRAIVADVAARGDEAVIELTRRFDRLELTPDRLRVSRAEIDDAVTQCRPEVLAALDLAAQRIETFHRRQIPANQTWKDATGTFLGLMWKPIQAVGLYVP